MGKKLVIKGVDYSANAIEQDITWVVKATLSSSYGAGGAATFVPIGVTIPAGAKTRLNIISKTTAAIWFGGKYSDNTNGANVWGDGITSLGTTAEFVLPKDLIQISFWGQQAGSAEIEVQVLE